LSNRKRRSKTYSLSNRMGSKKGGAPARRLTVGSAFLLPIVQAYSPGLRLSILPTRSSNGLTPFLYLLFPGKPMPSHNLISGRKDVFLRFFGSILQLFYSVLSVGNTDRFVPRHLFLWELFLRMPRNF